MSEVSSLATLLEAEVGMLRERDANGHRDASRLILGTRVDATALEQLEATLNWIFPEDYRRAVTELGLAKLEQFYDGHGPTSPGTRRSAHHGAPPSIVAIIRGRSAASSVGGRRSSLFDHLP